MLRVRLTGPRERRLAIAMQLGGLNEPEASAAMRRLDRYHADYLREFYDVDIDDPALYHLTIDATALDVEPCVELIVTAARAIR